MHTARTCCGLACTRWRTPGSLFDQSEGLDTLYEGRVSHPSCSWSYGANRVQVHADIKVCSEFLAYLQTDAIRGAPIITSLTPAQLGSRASCECCFSS